MWHAIWTHSHCEQQVDDQLRAKGFHLFFPRVTTWSKRGGARHRVDLPLFPGYLFVRNELDKVSYVEILKARGVVRVLGERWDRLEPIPDHEIDAIERAVVSGVPVLPHPHLHDGDRVRTVAGPLAGTEGILVKTRPDKGRLVLSISLLSRSVAVEVDCTDIQPISGGSVAQ